MEALDLISKLTLVVLLLPLAIVLAIGLVFSFLVLRYNRRKCARESSGDAPSRVRQFDNQDGPFTLNPDVVSRWCAIEGASLQAVERALGLQNLRPCPWDDWLECLGENSLFVSPTIRGWVLVVGPSLPDPAEDVDQCYHFLRRLSESFGRVQFFSLNRVVNYHAWVWMDEGTVRRAYVWAGETLWNQGEFTRAERELGLSCQGYGEPADGINPLANRRFEDNTSRVHGLAAKWSLDLRTIRDEMTAASLGMIGELVHSRRR